MKGKAQTHRRPPQRLLDPWAKPDTAPTVLVEAQGDLLRAKVVHRPTGRTVGGDRGEIRDFSAASRKSLLDSFARLDWTRAGFVCFITLTYPDREGPPSAKASEPDRTAFLKRLVRLDPLCSGFWRREWVPRKSGKYPGVVFPHFHLLVFNLPFTPANEINRMWGEVLGASDPVRTEIKGAKSRRQAMGYLSKYMAKVGQEGDRAARPAGGLRPGPEGAELPPCRAQRGGEGSLVNGAYLTATEVGEGTQESESVGRAWGTFNKKALPFAERRVFKAKYGEWIGEAKGIARHIWEGVNDEPAAGFTLYTDQADALFEVILGLSEGESLGTISGGEIR